VSVVLPVGAAVPPMSLVAAAVLPVYVVLPVLAILLSYSVVGVARPGVAAGC
jgi:hypothetical protein